MFCSNCGVNNLEEAVFCESCGKRLVQETFTELPSDQAVKREPAGDLKRAEQSAYAYQYAVQPTPSASKKPMSGRVKMILIAMLALAVLVIAFFCVGNTLSDTDRIAKSYFQQLSKNNWEKAYTYLDIGDTSIISESSYVKAFEYAGKYKNIKNFSVFTGYTDSYYGMRLSGGGGLTRNYTAEYICNGSTATKSVPITLIKQKEKTLFFFDTWKVSVADFTVSNYTIQADKGLQIYFDGVLLTEKYLTDTITTSVASNSSNAYAYSSSTYAYDSGTTKTYDADGNVTQTTKVNDDTYNYYCLPTVITGKHVIKSTVDTTVDSEEEVTISKDNQLKLISKISAKEDSVTVDAETRAKEFLYALFDSAENGIDFSMIQSYFSSNADTQSVMRLQYDNLKESFAGNGKNIGLKELEIISLKSQHTGDSTNNSEISVNLKFTYSYRTVEFGSSSDDLVENGPFTSSGQSKQFYFIRENNNWVIREGSPLSITY